MSIVEGSSYNPPPLLLNENINIDMDEVEDTLDTKKLRNYGKDKGEEQQVIESIGDVHSDQVRTKYVVVFSSLLH